jgi:DMATS type aromatic prenyltransferase
MNAKKTLRPVERELRARHLSSCPTPRLADHLVQRLRMLCAAAGFGGDSDIMSETLRRLLMPWGSRPLGQPSSWLSEVSDDNTPVEFSVAIAEGHADVRVLLEPQADEPTVGAYRVAGLAFNERLEREFGASLDRFRVVQDLFLPEDMQGPFAVWSSVVFSRFRAPSFKAYFNAQALGLERAASLVEEGLERLGFRSAWPSLRRSVLQRGMHLDELKYFALDLTSEAHARVKIYVRHHEVLPRDLEYATSAAANYVPGETLDFARAMRGGDERLGARAAFTCSAFVSENDARPVSTTAYVPVCAYAHDDAAVLQRICGYLVERGLDAALYDSIVRGFANRALDEGVGMQSWLALRRYRGSARITAYLATEANRVHAPGMIPAPTRVLPATAESSGIVRCDFGQPRGG